MSGIYSLLILLLNIIKEPAKSIKSIEIIAYDKDAMLRLFSILAAISGAIVYFLRTDKVSAGLLIIILIITPFLGFLIYNITALLLFLTFKLFGYGINASYGSIKTVLYPIFLILQTLYSVNSVISHYIPNLGLLLGYASDIWYYVMIFIILKSRLKQSTFRSIAISLIPFYLYLVLLAVKTFS